MQIGFNLPNTGPLSAPEVMTEIAQTGEALGFDYLTITDHVVLPNLDAPGYPYSESGEFSSASPMQRHEQLTMTAYVAAKTSRIRLVLAVIVVPHRQPVLAAKMLSTIDVLSGGRLVVGIGAGWLKAEFDAVVTTPFAERGKVTDEYLTAFRELWTQPEPKFEGNYISFQNIVLEPKPVQKPYPPIWVGGESAPSLRRAAKFGDAWYPIGTNKDHMYDTLPLYTAGLARLRKLTVDAGRAENAVAPTYRVKRYGAGVKPVGSDGNRRLFSGTDADVLGDLRALRDLGVQAVDIDFERPTAAEFLAEMHRFKQEILSRL
jgi:probable F420-dependent oxidoreductase